MALFDWLSSPRQQNQNQLPNTAALQRRIANDPYYRLRSLAEVRLAAQLGLKIDVNQASVDDWLRLPGISIHQARSLADLTQAGVHFYCLEDLAAALNLPPQRLQPLAPILNFSYYDPVSLATPIRVNPNCATAEQLAQIPGLGLPLAQAMVQERQKHGAYRNLADLHHRLALAQEQTTQLIHYLQF